MTDRDVVEKVAVLFGSNCCGPYSSQQKRLDGKDKKETYFTHLSGDKAAGWMMTLYPLMGIRRKEKIEELLSKWRTY